MRKKKTGKRFFFHENPKHYRSPKNKQEGETKMASHPTTSEVALSFEKRKNKRERES